MATSNKPLIAVINDDPAFLEFIASFVESETRFNTVVWDHGVDSLIELREHHPDLVILDVRMGDQNVGAEILSKMRQESDLRSIPVIICTADSRFLQEEADVLQSLDADVLEKPFDLDVLEEKVRRALTTHAADPESDRLDPVG